MNFAAHLLDIGSLGIVYPSVRYASGVNLTCFRPALVGNVRKGSAYRVIWTGSPEPSIELIDGTVPAQTSHLKT